MQWLKTIWNTSWGRWAATLALCVAIGATVPWWWPRLRGWVDPLLARHPAAVSHPEGDREAEQEVHEHEGHDHVHSEVESVELSPQAMRNLGLGDDTIQPVKLTTFRRSISVPGLVVGRPGRTQIQVATPMTGVVTHVHAVKGEAVEPGAMLFQIRLTHEEIVQAQTEFIRTLLELEVEKREIARLESVVREGAISGKTLLQRQYAKEKLDALLQAQREALRLHGLSDQQIDHIANRRRLLRELQIMAPSPDEHGHEEELRLSHRHVQPISYSEDGSKTPPVAPLIIEDLDVHKGQSVNAGERLCVLADYDRLYIEGNAFEQDLPALRETVQRKWPIRARFVSGETVDDLAIAYVPNEVNAASRSLHFYVDLPNTLERDEVNSDGQRFVSWRFRPGQRVQLDVPVEEWVDQIVLPVDALARDGAETFVFQQNGDHFDRVAVHTAYQDQTHVVVANDGSIFPGDKIALRGAHQLQMTLKNKSGGGVDPHAGHNH